MGKQRKLLKLILRDFEDLETDQKLKVIEIKKLAVKHYFKESLNKKDLVRRILFDALLSDDDILKLLRIIFDKEK